MIKQPETTDSTENTYPIDRQINYSFTLKNKSSKAIKNAEFWTYAPVKQTSTQICETIKSSHGYEMILDDYGNQILYYVFDVIPPYGSKIITITANVKLSENSNLIVANDTSLYLKPEKHIESDNPIIVKTAEKFKNPDILKTIKKTFEWVSVSIKYAGYISRDRGALYAMKNKKGDCTEYMYLFAALCRANQIPAKCVGGYICQGNSILKPSAYHNWVEVFNKGRWKIADPQKKVFFENQSHYISMRIIGKVKENYMRNFHRFRFHGKGLTVQMNG